MFAVNVILKFDEDGFNAEMTAQRERAKASSSFGTDYNNVIKVDSKTCFSGYTETSLNDATVIGLFSNGKSVESIQSG